MKTIFVIILVLFIFALILVAGISLIADAFKGLGEEPVPSGKPEPTTEERKNAKIREELARLRAGDTPVNAQQKMAERKAQREIENWRDGK